jgi:outer membrane protein assembly factor BamB
MWGGSPDRNAVSPVSGLPATWDVKTGENVRWSVPLGTYSYGGPVIADGRVYVGTNNARGYRPHSQGDRGCVLCLDADSGALLWQATHEKLAGKAPLDWPEQGVASTPYVDGDRVYYVSNRCELVCVDAQGFRDGENDGPFRSEAYTEAEDADFVWVLDMIGKLGVRPRALAASSPTGAGNLVFVGTGNGVDDEGEIPAPDAPSLIAVDKRTGEVVWGRTDPNRGLVSGQWSSPSYGVIGGQPQVVYGGGDGWCYAYEPATGKPLWRFNLNPPDAVWKIGGSGTKTSIVAMPVIHEDRVYLAVGDDPESTDGPGHLYCIDATQRGDITTSGKVWHFGGEDLGRTLSSVVIADGLLYVADLRGYLSCLDVKTGKRYWQHDMWAGVWASPVWIDGKVYLANTDGEVVVVKHDKTLKELARIDVRHAVYTPVAAHDGTLYIVTQKMLYAIGKPPLRATKDAWPMFRGDAQLRGVAASPLPEELQVRWKHELGEPVAGAAAIAGGVVYVGSEDGTLVALDLADGRLRWRQRFEDAIEASPTVVNGLVIFGDEGGVVRACAADSGNVEWTFDQPDGRVVSSATVAGDSVLFGAYDYALYRVRIADGQLLWKYETEERVHATPAVAQGRVFIAGCDGHLHVIDLKTGARVRAVELGAVTGCSPAVSGDHVFLGTYGQQVLGIDWRAGEVLWRYEDADRPHPFLSSAAVAGDLAVIGGRDRAVHALETKTGAQRWKFATRGKVDSSPVIVGERIFVGSADGSLYAVSRETGQKLWQFETGAGIHASPAVAAGCLVIGNDDGVIYCFGAAPQAP